jgi:RNA polymerase sigma-70 factor (ECF subfamily)
LFKKVRTVLFGPQEIQSLEGFHLLYVENAGFIRTSIYWMIRNDHVDDLVQETFIKAWNARMNFKGQSSQRTWLYRIAINCTYDYLRKEKIRQTDQFNESDVTSRDDNSLEKKDLIDKALFVLTIEQREVFIQFYKMGLSLKDIAELQDIPVGTVKSRLHSARTSFSEFIEKQEACYGQ